MPTYLIISFIVLTILTKVTSSSADLYNKSIQRDKVEIVVNKMIIIKSAVEKFCDNETILVDADLPTMATLISTGYLPDFELDNGYENNVSIYFNTSKPTYHSFVVKQNIDDDYAIKMLDGGYKHSIFGTRALIDTNKLSANYGDMYSTIIIKNSCK